MAKNLNHIHLIGSPEENFYILGKKDKLAFTELYTQISMLCARNNFLAKVIKTTTELAQITSKKTDKETMNSLKAYASGIEKNTNEVLFSLLLPEVVASFNKWVPNLMGVIPGCSSLFTWDEKGQGVIHSRILDYALSGPFQKEERTVLYDFSGQQKIFSFSTAGMPLPSLSAINESGLTLALHYKHGNYFNLEGESIFLIANEVLKTCTNTNEAIKLLKTKRSISYWGLYLSDRSGSVACVDICGPDLYQMKYDIKDHEYLYFNNRPILKKNSHTDLQPFGNLDQCRMRRNTIETKLKDVNFSELKDPMLEAIKLLGKPAPFKGLDPRKWNLSTITPSSIQLYSVHNSLNQAYFVPGEGPKFLQENLIKLENIFSTSTQKNIKQKHKVSKKYIEGYKRIANYQTAIDSGDTSLAYHEIQMAIEFLQHFPEAHLCRFFWCVTQYIHESDKRDFSYLYNELISLEALLPNYLEDHRKLFLMRVGKLLGHKLTDSSSQIKNQNLKKLYLDEYKLRPIALRSLKYLIFPRIEILDIIYAY